MATNFKSFQGAFEQAGFSSGQASAFLALLQKINGEVGGLEVSITNINGGGGGGGGGTVTGEVLKVPKVYGTLLMGRLVNYSGTNLRVADARLGYPATHFLLSTDATYYYLSTISQSIQLTTGTSNTDGFGIVYLYTNGTVTRDFGDVSGSQGGPPPGWPSTAIRQPVGRWQGFGTPTLPGAILVSGAIREDFLDSAV